MSDAPDLSSDDENYDGDEWQEIDNIEEPVSCLFCSDNLNDIKAAIKHCIESHDFNLKTLKIKYNMDCYSYIKMINFIRATKSPSYKISSAKTPIWEDDQYLKPVLNDAWLMYDFESLEESVPSGSLYPANVENGLVTLSEAHFTELQRTIHRMNEEISCKDLLLSMAQEDINKMKASMNVLIDSDRITSQNSYQVVDCVSKVAVEDDCHYFNSYSHFGIHLEMLSDTVRTETYKNAILGNSEILKGLTALDLGCGTGILSMFAATAGAKCVYALDQSDIVHHAMDIVRENGFHTIIEVIKGRLEDTHLPQKVDVIISEWMGYFLLFEGMLDSVIYARDKWLNPGGLLLPNKCNISIVANGDLKSHDKLIKFWSDVYGYKMNCMKSEVVREASLGIVSSDDVLSEPCIIKELNINTCTINDVNFSSGFTLPITKSGSMTSIVGYFDTFFDLKTSYSFSTGPFSTPTHWKQTIFYFKDTIKVSKGEIVNGKFTCTRSKTDVRALTINIELMNKKFKFILT